MHRALSRRFGVVARSTLALACLLAGGSTAAHAGAVVGTVYVDGTGACAGLDPCFATIQLGVNNAGPPPATVFVFPGTYAESVDLSLMGSAIAGMLGDLTLRTVNAAGVETDGTARVLPASGSPFFTSAVLFPGDLTIEGFTVQSPDNDGIRLNIGPHILALRNIVSDGNFARGVIASLTGTAVRITDSSFSNNKNGDGIAFGIATEVMLSGVTADGNQGGGANFAVSGQVNVINSSLSNNKNGDGLSFGTATDVIIDGLTADANQNDGASFAVTGQVLVGSSSFSNAKNGDGISFGTATEVRFERVTANANQNTGANFAVSGAVYVGSSSFNDAKNGGGISFGTATEVVFDDVTADGNQNSGANFGVSGPVQISKSSFSNAKNGDGINFGNATDVNVTGVVASDNSGRGLLTSLRSALITASRFERNATGVHLFVADPLGLVRLRCNDFVRNGIGLQLGSNVIIDARHNWWGSPSGPTNPANPGGTGDVIRDGTNGGMGTVLFIPFLTAPFAESGFCTPGVPAVGSSGMLLLALGLLVIPAWRLARRGAGR